MNENNNQEKILLINHILNKEDRAQERDIIKNIRNISVVNPFHFKKIISWSTF